MIHSLQLHLPTRLLSQGTALYQSDRAPPEVLQLFFRTQSEFKKASQIQAIGNTAVTTEGGTRIMTEDRCSSVTSRHNRTSKVDGIPCDAEQKHVYPD